jgi:two-component system chemotaxis sensor kinase CheA
LPGLEVTEEDLRVFFEETEEFLRMMEDDLVGLERGDQRADRLASIFRAAHTIKGSSATLGHRTMAELTHDMENVLDRLRKGQLQVNTAVVNHLFMALDLLRKLTCDLLDGRPESTDTSEVRRLLEEDLKGSAAAATTTTLSAASAPEGAASPNAVRAPAGFAAAGLAGFELTATEADALTSRLAGGAPLWRVQVDFDPQAAMLSVRAYQTYLCLEEHGALAATRPTLADIEQERAGACLTALLLSPDDPAALRTELERIGDIRLIRLEQVKAPDTVSAGEPAPAVTAVATASPTPGPAGVSLTPGPAGVSPVAEPAVGEGAAASGGIGSRGVVRTVRVSIELLDNLMNLVGELVIDRTRLTQGVGRLGQSGHQGADLTRELTEVTAHVGQTTTQLQEEIMRARMLPVDTLFRKFPRMVRDLAQRNGKSISLVVAGQDTELDRGVIEEIGDPIMHLLRNCVDHGIEPPAQREAAGKSAAGLVRLSASHQENHIVITVSDDGRGIDTEAIKAAAVRKGFLTAEAALRMSPKDAHNLIFLAGLTTAKRVSDVSGRGVGMDVVRRNIERLNGHIEIDTKLGHGTTITIRLPLTLAIIRALLVRTGGSVYAAPMASVVEALAITPAELRTVRGYEVIVNRGQVLPVHRLGGMLGEPAAADFPPFLVVVTTEGAKSGLLVDELLGDQEIVVKNLGQFLGTPPGLSGATILGAGEVALILDVQSLIGSVAPRKEKAA